MNEDTFRARLAEVQAKIEALPPDQQARLAPLVEETKERHYGLQKDMARLREAADDWRITMKYLVYDLERTRAELRELREREDEN